MHAATAGNAGNGRDRRTSWVDAGQREVPVAIREHDAPRAFARRDEARSDPRRDPRAFDSIPPLIDDLTLYLARFEQVDVRQAERAIGAPRGIDAQRSLLIGKVGMLDAHVQLTGCDISQPI